MNLPRKWIAAQVLEPAQVPRLLRRLGNTCPWDGDKC
jgi:hypothetical protein